MREIKVTLFLMFLLCVVSVPMVTAQSQPSEPGVILVGRISHVEGQLLRYVPEEKDWVVTVKDAPFGMDDALYSGEDAKAELIQPNNTWMRAGPLTQVQLTALTPDVTEIDVASGVVRLYDKSSDAVIKASTPFGYVMAQPGSTFDLYVGDSSLEVIALNGTVNFIHAQDGAKYEVVSGSSSIIADNAQVVPGEGNVDADWDIWNADRDSLWSQRIEVKGESFSYLPPALKDEAYSLEENGKWETVNYQGEDRQMWRPTTVSAGWAPYSVGRWTDYYGDNCWVPEESFGYITHHYGNWVFIESCNCWYWGPPAPMTTVSAGPAVGFSFGWYPGRVVWLYSGVDVGWAVLTPVEPYYSYHAWGPAAIVVGSAAVNIDIARFGYINHAVVVNQNSFYSVNNYTNVRITNIDRMAIINNYHAAPVVNNTVIQNYSSIKQRYNFTNAQAAVKPHQSVLGRIESNQAIVRQQGRTVSAKALQQNVANAPRGGLAKAGSIGPPKLTSKIVPANQVNTPREQLNFRQKDLVTKPKPAQMRTQPQAQGTAGSRGKHGQSVQGKGKKKSTPAARKAQQSRHPEAGGLGRHPEAGVSKATGGVGRDRRSMTPSRSDRRPRSVESGRTSSGGQGVRSSRGQIRTGQQGGKASRERLNFGEPSRYPQAGSPKTKSQRPRMQDQRRQRQQRPQMRQQGRRTQARSESRGSQMQRQKPQQRQRPQMQRQKPQQHAPAVQRR